MPKHVTTHHDDPSQEPVLEEAPEVTELRAALQQAQDDRDRANDQLLRTMADFQNFRKRVLQENEQMKAFATERLVTQLLPVLDNFERALASYEGGANVESVMGGIRAVDRQIRMILEGQKVERIPAEGQAFDPDYHEAIATEHSDVHPEGTVLGEIEAGYKMADKVIRPARVKVSKKQ